LPNEPLWIDTDQVISINEWIVAETSEPHRLFDRLLLESAVERPINRWWFGGEIDLLRLATTLLYGIAKNHPFEQGNKRTGTVAALIFLNANGLEWTLPDEGELAGWVNQLVVDELSEHELAELMRPHAR